MDLLFRVADTGVGIPADEVAKVFEDFGQANTTVWRRRGGSGLGVPISRRFVLWCLSGEEVAKAQPDGRKRAAQDLPNGAPPRIMSL